MPTIPIFAESSIFTADFRITILYVKIPANNDFNTLPDKIKGVTTTSTLMWRKLAMIPAHR